MGDFEQMSEIDQQEGGESSQPLNDNDYAGVLRRGRLGRKKRIWAVSSSCIIHLRLPKELRTWTRLAEKNENCYKTMSGEEDTTNERTSLYNLQPSEENRLHADTMANS